MFDELNLQRIDVLKLDVEGAEIAVLNAASDDTLLRCRQISVEFHDFVEGWGEPYQITQIEDRLRCLGFHAFRLIGHGNMDVLFLNCDSWYRKLLFRYICRIGRPLYWRFHRRQPEKL